MGILTVLFFILFIIAFPLGELLNFSLGKSINLSLLEIVSFLIFLFWLFIAKTKKIRTQLFLPLIIFSGIILLSLILNVIGTPLNMLLIAVLYAIRWLLYLSIYFVVLNSSDKVKDKIVYFMGIGGLLLVIAGYVQYFFYPSLLELYKYGWDKHLYRLVSTFLDPNFFGIMLSLVFILSFYFLNKFKKRKHKISYYLYPSCYIHRCFTYLFKNRSLNPCCLYCYISYYAKKNKILLWGLWD